MIPKYPDINVQLSGQDGNAFNLLGIMRKELRKNDIPDEEIKEFLDEAMSGDYDHLLQTCMKYVNID